MEENLICSVCGATLTKEIAKKFDRKIFCEHCLDEQSVLCNECDTRIYRYEAEGDSCHILCSNCYDRYYTSCEDCGRLIHRDNAYYDDDNDYPYCYECYQKLENSPIKNYSYKPDPIFYGSGNLFYGIELEIDKGGEYNENAQILMDIANKSDKKIYCKHDGSKNNGFEIVTHPMSFEYATNKMNWHDLFDKAINL